MCPTSSKASSAASCSPAACPWSFPTISIHESFAHPTSMFLRNLMAMDTEEMVRAQPMDCVVVIGGCDKNLPAQVMAIASADVPAIVLPTGPMLVGHLQGRSPRRLHRLPPPLGAIPRRQNRRSRDRVISGRLCPSVGTCSVMGTASTMACLVEALGLALPMSATAPATHADRRRIAEASGKRAAEMATTGAPRPSDLITAASVRNAMIVLQAIGGSTNGLIHLIAIAGRAGVKFDLDVFDQLGREIPVLLNLKPSGAHYMEHFHHAGGLPALMRELRTLLDLTAPTVSGGTLGDAIATPKWFPTRT
jgi:dihydroxy-acid dehydratase